MNAKSNGLQAFETVGQFLQQKNWHAELLEDYPYTYHALFPGKNAEFSVYARIRPELELLLCYAASPFEVPEERLSAAAEFVARANYGLRIGNFELDFSDGEIRYKSTLDFADEPLTQNLLRNTLYPCCYMLDKYLPAIYALIYENKSPLEAIKLVEA